MDFKRPHRMIRASRRSRGPSFSLTPRDGLIMRYIWRWKVASTASIHDAINRTQSPYSTYKVLERLEKNGFLESRFHFMDKFNVWQLTERGFFAIKDDLGELKEDGYLSENYRHDRLVQAFQLGEWSTYQMPQVSFFTEQEIRRSEVEEYPEWLPPTNEHRADGYTRLVGQEKSWTLAFEVELSAKGVQRYEGALRFYRAARGIDRVLWLVGSTEVKKTILRAKACTRDDSSNYHVFVDLNDFLKDGWDAPATNERSETLFTLREKYRGILGGILGETLGKFRGLDGVNVHLAGQKVIGKSRR